MLLSTFFSFTATDTTALLGYVSGFMSDISPLLLPIIAVSVGLLIFWGITSAIKK